MLGEKREKIWLGRDLNPKSVDQKLIMVTITQLIPCWEISKYIYVTYFVMRQKVSLVLSFGECTARVKTLGFFKNCPQFLSDWGLAEPVFCAEELSILL